MSKMIILSLLLSVLSSSVHSMDDVMEPAFSQKDERPLNISLNSIIEAHKETLPKISFPLNKDPIDKANTIASFLATCRDGNKIRIQKKQGVINKNPTGLDLLSQKIASLIKADKEIVLYGPMFSFKGIGKDKTLTDEKGGILNKADLGEMLSLITLKNIAVQISKIYEKGCRVDVCSDGYIFTGVLGIDPKIAKDYATSVSNLLKRIPGEGNVCLLTNLSQNVDLSKAPDVLDNDPKIERLMPFYAREIDKDINDPLVRNTAKEAHKSASAFSTYLKGIYEPEGIRISIHTDLEELNLNVKVPIHMIPFASTTAPHGCPVVLKDGEKIRTLVKRKNADLSIDNGACSFFKKGKIPAGLTPSQLPLVVDQSLGVDIPFYLLDVDLFAKKKEAGKSPADENILTDKQKIKMKRDIEVRSIMKELINEKYNSVQEREDFFKVAMKKFCILSAKKKKDLALTGISEDEFLSKIDKNFLNELILKSIEEVEQISKKGKNSNSFVIDKYK